jgi:SAM-dependent methyltransferase
MPDGDDRSDDVMTKAIRWLWTVRWLANPFRRREVVYLRGSLAGLPPSPLVLDIGCADGKWIPAYARPDFRVVAVDIDKAALADLPSTTASGVAASGTCLPMPDAIFDAVVLLSSLEHVPEDTQLLRECSRVLKPGGVLALTTDACSENVMSAAERRQHMAESYCVRTYDETFPDLLRRQGYDVVDAKFAFSHRLGVRLGKLGLQRLRYFPYLYLARPLLARDDDEGGLMIFAHCRADPSPRKAS